MPDGEIPDGCNRRERNTNLFINGLSNVLKRMANSARHVFLIKGKVQRAGFRAKIKDVAKAHGLIGFTKNLQNYDEDVLVVGEGDKRKIDGFLSGVEKLKIEQAKVIGERERLDERLSRLNEDLDSKLISKRYKEDSGKILMLLERKKSILRELKFYESKMSPYLIKEIVSVKGITEYENEIGEVDYGNDFKIIRVKGEESDRLDEGIEALIDLRYSTSNLNYDIIDTDFAMLNIKYGALTEAVTSGFRAFPENFANAFDTVLDRKYGIKPRSKK